MKKRFTSFLKIRQKYVIGGFTLIELLIVVAIMALLVIIATPRFGSMVRKAREATSKGNLGVLRSAIKIYYSSNDGIWPWQLDTTFAYGDRINPGPIPPHLDINNNALVPDYIDKIPPCYSGQGVAWGTSGTGHEHEGGNWLEVSDSSRFTYTLKADQGWDAEWLYWRDTGEVWINCDLDDLKENKIYTW